MRARLLIVALVLAALPAAAHPHGHAPEHAYRHAPTHLRRFAVQRTVPRPVGWAQTGEASWYGPGFQGHRTSDGERYNQWGFTCAHPTLPAGTVISLTNLDTGASARARVNDRGPYASGGDGRQRITDCSHRIARALGYDRAGHARLLLRVLRVPDYNEVAQLP